MLLNSKVISDFIQNNSFAIIFLAICTVLGTFLTIFLRHKKCLSSKLSVYPLIQNNISSISKINILYEDMLVPNLSISKFVIWNSGNISLRQNDIVPLAPLCIKSCNDNTQILDIGITVSNAPENNPVLKKNASTNEYHFSFDYLDKNNGVIIQVIHTGDFSDLHFTGKIIGGKVKNEDFTDNKLGKILFNPLPEKALKIIDAFTLISIGLTLLLFILLFAIAFFLTPYIKYKILYIIIILLLSLLYYAFYQMYFRVPKSLRSYSSFKN